MTIEDVDKEINDLIANKYELLKEDSFGDIQGVTDFESELKGIIYEIEGITKIIKETNNISEKIFPKLK